MAAADDVLGAGQEEQIQEIVLQGRRIELRARPDELFVDTVKRIGVEPFKERVYAAH